MAQRNLGRPPARDMAETFRWDDWFSRLYTRVNDPEELRGEQIERDSMDTDRVKLSDVEAPSDNNLANLLNLSGRDGGVSVTPEEMGFKDSFGNWQNYIDNIGNAVFGGGTHQFDSNGNASFGGGIHQFDSNGNATLGNQHAFDSNGDVVIGDVNNGNYVSFDASSGTLTVAGDIQVPDPNWDNLDGRPERLLDDVSWNYTGLKITDSYLGYFESGSVQSYIQNDGYIFFGSSGTYFEWDPSSGWITLTGNIQLPDPPDPDWDDVDGKPSYVDMPSFHTGLAITSSYLGYFNSGSPEVWIDSSGDFFFGGNNRFISWDGSELLLVGDLRISDGSDYEIVSDQDAGWFGLRNSGVTDDWIVYMRASQEAPELGGINIPGAFVCDTNYSGLEGSGGSPPWALVVRGDPDNDGPGGMLALAGPGVSFVDSFGDPSYAIQGSAGSGDVPLVLVQQGGEINDFARFEDLGNNETYYLQIGSDGQLNFQKGSSFSRDFTDIAVGGLQSEAPQSENPYMNGRIPHLCKNQGSETLLPGDTIDGSNLAFSDMNGNTSSSVLPEEVDWVCLGYAEPDSVTTFMKV